MNAPEGAAKAHPYNEMNKQKNNKVHNKRRAKQNNNKPLRDGKRKEEWSVYFSWLGKILLESFFHFSVDISREKREIHLINVLNITNTQKYKAVCTIEWQPH